jgi:hypothetical protein
VTAVTTKTDPLALVERVQALLAQAAAPLAKLEQGLLEIERIVASCETDLEEIGNRRKIEMTAATPAGELDKRLDALDKREREVVRRFEIAKTVRAEVENRIDAACEADAADKRQAAYNEAFKLRDATALRVRELLGRFGPECRKVMREYAESELKTASANSDLPIGAAPIRSIEAERRGDLRSTETTAREFKGFTHGRRFIGEQGHVEAVQRKDGTTWDVYLPAGSTGAGDYCVCELVAYVEVVTEADATPWPEFLATSLSCPAFSVAQHPAWRPIPADNLGPPDQILIELDKLESLPQPQFPPRVETRVMTLAQWRALNGEPVEAVAAE